VARAYVAKIPRYLLPLAALLLVAAVVGCGSDNDGAQAAAAEFSVDGDMLTWSPPWQTVDARTVTVTSSIELSPVLQAKASQDDSDAGGLASLVDQQATTVGTVTIKSVGDNGSKAELAIAFQDLLNKLQQQMAGTTDSFNANAGMAEAALGFINQLDLGVDFGVDGSGAITSVTNLEELAAEVKTLVNLAVKFAALSEGDGIDPATIEKIDTAFAELPKTNAAQTVAKSMVQGATGNLFLMRSGEYKVGQPVAVAGSTSMFGLQTDGNTTYEVTGITNDVVTVVVKVTPCEVDMLAMAEQFANEIAPIIGEDPSKLTDKIAELDSSELGMISALSEILFAPYTVTLTLDSQTGWVKAADWDVTFTATEALLAGPGDDDSHFDGVNPSDLWVTMHLHSDFAEPVTTTGE
jgi:hypothetical protein